LVRDKVDRFGECGDHVTMLDTRGKSPVSLGLRRVTGPPERTSSMSFSGARTPESGRLTGPPEAEPRIPSRYGIAVRSIEKEPVCLAGSHVGSFL
jgi:hypothetical protein